MASPVRRYVSVYCISDIITLGIFYRPQSLKEPPSNFAVAVHISS